MDKEVKGHYFAARQIQATIAILVMVALLVGTFLLFASKGLSTYFGFKPAFLGIFLAIGYTAIIVFLAIFFSHRLVGPFKRLEYEMKIISKGGLGRRLTIRAKDDLHVRNFVTFVNEFIENFEEMSKKYSKLNSTISIQLGDIVKKIEKGEYNPEEIREALKSLQRHIGC